MILDCLDGPRVISTVLIKEEEANEYGSERERYQDAMRLALKMEGHELEERRWPRKPEKARQWLFPYGLQKERGPADPFGRLT